MENYYSEADVQELMKELELSIEDREKLQAENEDLWEKLQQAEQMSSKLKQAESEKLQLQRSLQEQSKLMKLLCESSDSEMPKRLNERLNENEKLLLKEKEKNEQLRKQLQDAAVSAGEDKKASDRRISRLERKLESNRFDKEQYLKSLEMREKAVDEKRASLNRHIRDRADEIEKNTIAHYKAAEEALEAEKAKCIEQQRSLEAERQEWLLSEKEKINNEVEQRIKAHKATLDKQNAKERVEEDKEYIAKKKALKVKYASISGVTVIGGFISAIVALCSAVIAFVHGLLPFMISDSKEIGKWISSDLHSIFGKVPAFPKPVFPVFAILQLALPLIFLIIVGIWTAFDFDERKWVVFVDEMSCIVIGSSIGISAVFGKQLSWIGINTLMFPLAVYFLYVLIRWLWEIDTFDAAERLLMSATEKWRNLEKNEKQGYALMGIVIIAAVILFRFWW